MSNVSKFRDAENVEQYYHFVKEEEDFGEEYWDEIPNEFAPPVSPTFFYNNDDFIRNQVHNAHLEDTLKMGNFPAGGYSIAAQEPALNLAHPNYNNYPQQPQQQYQTNFAPVKCEEELKKEEEKSMNKLREFIKKRRMILTANEMQQKSDAHAQNANNQWNATGPSAHAQSRANAISWYDEVEKETSWDTTPADSLTSCSEWNEAEKKYQQQQNQRNFRAPRAGEAQKKSNNNRRSGKMGAAAENQRNRGQNVKFSVNSSDEWKNYEQWDENEPRDQGFSEWNSIPRKVSESRCTEVKKDESRNAKAVKGRRDGNEASSRRRQQPNLGGLRMMTSAILDAINSTKNTTNREEIYSRKMLEEKFATLQLSDNPLREVQKVESYEDVQAGIPAMTEEVFPAPKRGIAPAKNFLLAEEDVQQVLPEKEFSAPRENIPPAKNFWATKDAPEVLPAVLEFQFSAPQQEIPPAVAVGSFSNSFAPLQSSSDSEEERLTSFSGHNSGSSSFESCSDASYVDDAKPLYRKHQLLGDSQFVRFARQILGVKVVKNSISYCVSGQKIQGLHHMLLYSEFRLHDRVILMIGTNDLRNNSSLTRMKDSYKKLLDLLKKSCKKIVLVTLPPIQCMIDSAQHRRTLEGFNKFILEQHNGNQLFVVDFGQHLVGYGGSSGCREYFEECYASNPNRKDLMHLNKKGFLLLKFLLDVHYFH